MKNQNCDSQAEKEIFLFQSIPSGLRGPVSPFFMTKIKLYNFISFTVHGSTIANYCGHYIRPQQREHHSSLIVEIVRVSLRLVFTSDGVGVGVVVGVIRELMTKWKSKIGVVSGVISSTESESEESERFHFLPIPVRLWLRRLWSSEN